MRNLEGVSRCCLLGAEALLPLGSPVTTVTRNLVLARKFVPVCKHRYRVGSTCFLAELLVALSVREESLGRWLNGFSPVLVDEGER